MRKLFIITVVAVFALLLASPAWCGSIFGGDTYYDITNEGGTGIGVGIGHGGDATIEHGAVQNFNTDFNSNHNENINTNINSNYNSNRNYNTNLNHQGQDQGQLQGQAQGQGQGQQQQMKFQQSYIAPRDHIRGPELLRSRPSFRDGKANDIRMLGFDILKAKDSFTWAEASRLCSAADDLKVEKALLFENDFRTLAVFQVMKVPTGVLMGYVYVLGTGSDSYAAAAVGRLAKAAMEIGGTHFEVVGTSATEEGVGGAYNIGLGGGASIMANGDRAAIAPNGGLGYGKAWTHNEQRPAIAAKVFYDEKWAKKVESQDWSK